MTRARFGRRRNDRRTVRKREDSWLLRRSTTGPRAPRRRRSAASDCRWFAIGVMKFNADGPEGLIDRKAPGQPPRLNDGHRAALAAILESGPISAVHGVVRWRIVDLCQWIFEEFRVALSQQTSAARCARWVIASSRPAPAIMPRPPALSRILKKPPHAPGRDRAREGRRSQRDRTLVRRRVASWAEEQDHPPLGQAQLAPKRPERPADRLGLHFRRDLSEGRQRRRARHAATPRR